MADYEKLFDFDDDLDVNLLEAVALAAVSPQGQMEQVRLATNTLIESLLISSLSILLIAASDLFFHFYVFL